MDGVRNADNFNLNKGVTLIVESIILITQMPAYMNYRLLCFDPLRLDPNGPLIFNVDFIFNAIKNGKIKLNKGEQLNMWEEEKGDSKKIKSESQDQSELCHIKFR